MGNEAGKLGNRQEFCCLQSQVVICAGMIDDSGDMDIAGSRKLVADPNAGTEASGSKCYKADMFRYAEGGVDRNNKRIRITVIHKDTSKCIGYSYFCTFNIKYSCMDSW